MPSMTMAPPAPSFTLETITPQVAAEYLLSNVENRPMRQRYVHALARDMQNGAWQMTGDPIRFDEEGILQDGQHRLAACVEAGVSIESIVMRDSPTSVRRVIDSGNGRTAGDVLQMDGFPSAHALAATARIALTAEAGGMSHALANGTPAFTHDDIVTWVQSNQDRLLTAVRISARHRIRGAREAATSYVVLELLKVATELEVSEFFDSIQNYQTSGKGDPRVTLIEFFGKAKDDRRAVSVSETVFAFLRTWNAYRRGERLTILRFASPGAEKGGRKQGLPMPAAV